MNPRGPLAVATVVAVTLTSCSTHDDGAEPNDTTTESATGDETTVATTTAPTDPSPETTESAASDIADEPTTSTEPVAATDSDSSQDSALEPTSVPPQRDTGLDASTRMIETDFGTFEIPTDPKRLIVTDAQAALPTVLDLGVEVYGTWDASGVGRPAGSTITEEEWESFEFVGAGGANVELLAAAKPDLVVHTLLDPGGDEIELITAFAPLVPLQRTLDWQADSRAIATFLDREAELDTLLAEYRSRAAALAARVDNELGDIRIAVVRVRPDALRVHTNLHFSGELLAGVGIGVPEKFDFEPAGDRADSTLLVNISLELLESIDTADYVFVMPVGTALQSEEDVQASLEQLLENPLWQRLPAVEAGRLAVIGDHWFTGSLRAANRSLDDVERILFDS